VYKYAIKSRLMCWIFISVTSNFFAIMSSKKTGILAILGASIMWSLEPVFAKLAYASSDYLQTSAIRAIVVVLTALLYVLITGVRKLKVTKNQLSKILYIAVAGTLVGDLLYFFALTKISVLNAVMIGHMQPIFIILIGFFFLKEDKLTKFDYMGIFTMIIAGVFVTTKTLENLSMIKLGTVGDIYVLLATAAWATTAIVTRKYLRELNAGVVTFYRYLIASVVFVFYLSFKSSLVLSNIYQVLVGIIVGAGTILYYESIKRINALFCGIAGFLSFKRGRYSHADFRNGSIICGSLLLIQKRRGVFLNVFILKQSGIFLLVM